MKLQFIIINIRWRAMAAGHHIIHQANTTNYSRMPLVPALFSHEAMIIKACSNKCATNLRKINWIR